MTPLAWLIVDIFLAGVMSFGGLAAVLSSMRDNMVLRQHMVSLDQFTESYAMAVAAPGSSVSFLALLGYDVAGPLGAVLGILAWSLPTLTLLDAIGRTASSRAEAGIKSVRKALVPVVGGLLVAGALTAASGFLWPLRQWILTGVGLVVLLLRPRLNPAWVVLGSSLLGAWLLQPA